MLEKSFRDQTEILSKALGDMYLINEGGIYHGMDNKASIMNNLRVFSLFHLSQKIFSLFYDNTLLNMQDWSGAWIIKYNYG